MSAILTWYKRVAIVAFFAAGAVLLGAGPATQSDSAAPENAIKSTLKQLNEATSKGDWEAIQKVFFDDGSPASHQVQVGTRWSAAQIRMAMALDDVLGKDTTPVAKSVAKQNEENSKYLEAIVIKVSGNTAEVSSTSRPSQIFVLRDGKWLLDVGATYRKHDAGIPDEGATPLREAQTAVFEKIIPDIKARDFKTLADFQREIGKRLNAIPDPSEITNLKVEDMKRWLEAIGMALAEFQHDNGRFPTTEEGLGALIKAPTALAATWKGPYWKDDHLPLDNWGNPLVYENPNAKQAKDLVFCSAGPDGKRGTADDVKADSK